MKGCAVEPSSLPAAAQSPNRVTRALGDLRAGGMVVLRGGADREFEGDLIAAAELAGPGQINFMAKEARGLISLALSAERCDELGLKAIDPRGMEGVSSVQMISIEARSGVTTGISVADRARTIAVAVDPRSEADDLVQPGHVIPLRVHPGGVLGCHGRAEVAAGLAGLAGLRPAAVLCEIMRDDGRMAKGEELEAFASAHGLVTVGAAEVVAHRLRTETSLESLPFSRSGAAPI